MKIGISSRVITPSLNLRPRLSGSEVIASGTLDLNLHFHMTPMKEVVNERHIPLDVSRERGLAVVSLPFSPVQEIIFMCKQV